MRTIILLLSMVILVNSQTIINYQNASTITYVDATTPNDPNDYSWSEITNIKQGVHVSVIPSEKIDIFLQQNNSWINYNTWNWGLMQRLEVSYDGGNWQTIFSNQSKDATGWIESPFTSLGYHNISLRWYSYELSYERSVISCLT